MKVSPLALDLRVLIGALVALAVGVFLVTALFGLFNPRDTSQPEGAVVAGALRVAHGEPLFLDIRRGPYVTAMYGPFIYMMLGGLVKLFGAGITGAYLLGRVLSLLSAIACAAMVAGLSRRCGANSFGAWVAGGLFLASPVILPVAYSTRSDLPALVLALAGVTLFLRWSESPRFYLAALPLVAAAFTKQTALAAAVAIGLFLILEGRIGRGILFPILVVATCGGILLLLNRATGSLATLNLLEVPGASPLNLGSRPLGALAGFLSTAALPLILAAPALSRAAQGDRRLRFPLCYFLAALAVSIAGSTKLGSDSYYFMEPLAAALVLSGVGLSSLMEEGTGSLKNAPAAVLLGLFAVGIAASVGLTARLAQFRYEPNDQVIQVAAQASGDVLIEDENVALKCGKPLTIMDPFAFAYMEKRSRWDAGPLNRRILARDFGAIILRSPLEHPSHYQGEIYWSPTTLEAMERAYRMEERVDGYFVYRPRDEIGSAQAGGNS
ncbi:MAG: hypothetical protein L0170_17425 [Acidobacteria bacterium]|nr:hypothetical protein [Acidobacteriota bacterium]